MSVNTALVCVRKKLLLDSVYTTYTAAIITLTRLARVWVRKKSILAWEQSIREQPSWKRRKILSHTSAKWETLFTLMFLLVLSQQKCCIFAVHTQSDLCVLLKFRAPSRVKEVSSFCLFDKNYLHHHHLDEENIDMRGMSRNWLCGALIWQTHENGRESTNLFHQFCMHNKRERRLLCVASNIN
jgi:hypothetical protein